MRSLSKQDRTYILSDPVAACRERQPHANDERIAMLQELHKQRAGLQQRCRDLQKETRTLSRQIGTAKRDGAAIDELLTLMRTRSAELKALSAREKETARAILGYFTEIAAGRPPVTPSVVAPARYPETDEPEVVIKPLGDRIGEWNDYVAGHPAATIYHRAEWRDVIGESFGHDCRYFTAIDNDGQIRGILPLVHLDSRIFGSFMVSMPYFNYGGALAGHPGTEARLMDAANNHALKSGIAHIEYRDTVKRSDYPSSNRKVCMHLALPDRVDLLWNSFSSKLRAQVRRPQRENPQVMIGGLEYLDDFYAVFARNMRDLGTPVYGKHFFRNILQAFDNESTLVCIRLHGRPVAAAFLLDHGARLEIPWASTLREVNHLSINMLLYWEVLKFAVDKQYRIFDFGRSSRQSGTYRFKQQWGARPVQLHWHYWLAGGRELPAINPENPKYALAIGVWKHLPLFLSNAIGPRVVKYLP